MGEGNQFAPDRFAGATCRPHAKPSGEISQFVADVLGQAGLNPQAYRNKALERRIPACLRALRVNSPDQAIARLRSQPHLLAQALNALLIGVSEFFRDRAVFAHLQGSVLPILRASRHEIRVYSAGSSEGQELYSVAMLLAELGALKNSRLLGVDCRPDAVHYSRAAHYDLQALAQVPVELRARYFSRTNTRAVVAPVVRKQVEWKVGDLLNGPPDEWDLILFRNVAIYLAEPFVAAVWERLCEQLSPGGYLITGRAEAPPSFLPLTRIDRSVYRKFTLPPE